MNFDYFDKKFWNSRHETCGHLDEDDGYTVVEIIVPKTPNKVKKTFLKT